jgi:tRNA modification GTPase
MSSNIHQPTAALLTPGGRGAVATIRFLGCCSLIDESSPSLFQAANSKPIADQPINRIVFGHWGTEIKEEVVLCRTGETALEIHCHGGDVAARRIFTDLESLGVQIQSWQAQQQQLTGSFETELLEALSKTTTQRTAQIVLEQRSGLLKTELQFLSQVEWTESNRAELESRLERLLHWSNFGLHLTQPWKVVLLGRPNVGKSSLINRLLGYDRAIVFDQPGTTRDVVTGETAFDGWPIMFSDTAGLREQADELESAGIELARTEISSADSLILLIDLSQPPTADDRSLIEEYPQAILVGHKADLPDAWGSELPVAALLVSSKTQQGLEELTEQFVRQLIPEIPERETPIPVTKRQIDYLTVAFEALNRNDEGVYRAALLECLS